MQILDIFQVFLISGITAVKSNVIETSAFITLKYGWWEETQRYY